MTPTADKLLALIGEAGVPLTLDQMMDVLPYADRKAVGKLCRDLVHIGTLRSSVEDGQVAYDLANGVARIKPRTSSAAPLTNLERIRQLLAGARKPPTTDEVVSGLSDMEPPVVRKALSNGAYRRLWSSTRGADGIHVWSLPKSGAASATAVAVATATATPAPAAAAPAAPAASAARAPAVPPAPSAPFDTIARVCADMASTRPSKSTNQTDVFDHAVNMAEVAREAYVLSKVDADVYTLLQQSVIAARAARDAFAGGAT